MCKFKALNSGKNEVIQMLCEHICKENDVMHKQPMSFSKGTFPKGHSQATWEL